MGNPRADALYAKVTDRIVAAIEAGIGTDWQMPWRKLGGVPTSLSSGKPYRGINWWILSVESMDRGFDSHQWGTYNQWQAQGFQVQKGETSTEIFLFKPGQRPSKKRLAEDPNAKSFLLTQTFRVFAREQTDAPPLVRTELTEHERLQAAEEYFASVGAEVREGGDRAFYAVVGDYIGVPKLNQFVTREHFYSTLAHEHTHWTGHPDRLDRDIRNRFGSEAYAMEELVAELGAAFWCAQMGIDQAPRPDHAMYLAHWLSVLRADPKALQTTASKASDALEFLNKTAGWTIEPAEHKEMATA
jgi:antirestriction protein ArdC